MKTRAAIGWKAGQPLEVVTLDLAGPKTGEVLVEIKARAGAFGIEEAIADRQWRRIAAAAEQFCARRPAYAEFDRRYDALFLARKRWPRHVADAWRPSR